jgi:phosphonate transport system substrate-binding protein
MPALPTLDRRSFCQLALVPLALPLAGCGGGEEGYQPQFTSERPRRRELSFAVHPLHNPALLHQIYGPLVEYLNATTRGPRFALVASRDYATFNGRLAARDFDFALPNPYQTVRAAAAGYSIFAKVAGDDGFRGLILTRRDSPIRTIADLRGKTISYAAPTAVAGAMLPQYYLHRHGLPLSATRSLYVGSMESALRSLGIGASDAAAVWPGPWQKFRESDPAAASALQVRWETPHLVNNGVVVRDGILPGVTARILAALRRLGDDEAGRRLLRGLGVAGFEPATSRTYDPVRRFLSEFSRTVRPIDLPAGVAA